MYPQLPTLQRSKRQTQAMAPRQQCTKDRSPQRTRHHHQHLDLVGFHSPRTPGNHRNGPNRRTRRDTTRTHNNQHRPMLDVKLAQMDEPRNPLWHSIRNNRHSSPTPRAYEICHQGMGTHCIPNWRSLDTPRHLLISIKTKTQHISLHTPSKNSLVTSRWSS